MLDIHALIRDFLQQQTVVPLSDASPPGQYYKAGVVPFTCRDGFRYYVMKPRGTLPGRGEPPFQLCKGTRMYQVPGVGWCDMREGTKAAEMETLLETAVREGIEELGLKPENVVRFFDLGAFGFSSVTTGKAKSMWLFAAELESEDDFLPDRDIAATTAAREWLSAGEFAVAGREDHRYIVEELETRLTRYFTCHPERA